MKYHLKKNNLKFETDYAVMADRKIAQGWELIPPLLEPKAIQAVHVMAKGRPKKSQLDE